VQFHVRSGESGEILVIFFESFLLVIRWPSGMSPGHYAGKSTRGEYIAFPMR